MSRALPLITIAALMGTASAEPSTSTQAAPTFAWRAPVGCPSEADVQQRLEHRLGGAIDGIQGVEIEVTRGRNEYVANIDARAITVANAVRTLRSRQCAALADAVAVVLARMASEARDARPLAPPSGPKPAIVADAQFPVESRRSSPLAASVSSEQPRPHAHEPSPVGTWGGGLRVLGLSGVGALPAVNLGGELGGYVRRDEVYAELAVSKWIPQGASFANEEATGVEVNLTAVTLRGGWASHLPIRAWGTVEVGSLSGDRMSDLAPSVLSRRWVALGAGFGVAWPMSDKARLIGTFELVVPIGSPTAMLDSGVELWRPAPAAARSAVGIEVGFR